VLTVAAYRQSARAANPQKTAQTAPWTNAAVLRFCNKTLVKNQTSTFLQFYIVFDRLNINGKNTL